MDTALIILNLITQGGAAAVIALLFFVIAALVWDRKNLTKDLTATTERVYSAKDSETQSLKEIVDKYHQGNIDLIQALNEIKLVLVSIQNTRN